MQPKISIIVPIYNGEKYIPSFIKCIQNQQYKSIEVILVDDGSTDNSFCLCKSLAEKDDRIFVFNKTNGGPSSARNYGIEKSTGEYLVFFDIDDEFADNILSDNIQMAIENDSDIVMWNFKIICSDNKNGVIKKIGKSSNDNASDFFYSNLIPVLDNEMFNPPWNKLIRRKLIIDHNIRFDEKFSIYEDILFSYQIMQNAERISINDNVYYDYIIKESGSLLTKFHSECFNAILEIYDASIKYGNNYEDNHKQMVRFKRQMIYLTKGYIKQICTNYDLSYHQKKNYLAEIADNSLYAKLSKEYDKDGKSLPAKFMMKYRMFGLLICFYNTLNVIR